MTKEVIFVLLVYGIMLIISIKEVNEENNPKKYEQKHKYDYLLEDTYMNPYEMPGYTAKVYGGNNSQEFRKKVARAYYPYIYGEEKGRKKAEATIFETPENIIKKYVKECKKRGEPIYRRM